MENKFTKKEFMITFQLSKTKIFDVQYYTLLNNNKPYFSTSVAEFCKNKLDFKQCGQAQGDILPPFHIANKFYKKWDKKHLADLTTSEYFEIIEDLEALKNKYSYILIELENKQKPYNPHISFYTIAEFTKQDPKKHNIKII